MNISIDMGDTLMDRNGGKFPFGKDFVYPLFNDAKGVLAGLAHVGHKLTIISKIDQGQEARVTLTLLYHNLVPYLISARSVRVCYSREGKGVHARELLSDIHIDDRVEALNAVHAVGVRHKILFTKAHDDRKSHTLSFKGVFVAKNWIEVMQIISNLPPG